MLYQLNENVYLVLGYKNSCIYDLNQCKLYALNDELSKQFNFIRMGILTDRINDIELKECLNYFIDNGVLVLSETAKFHNIEDIMFTKTRITFAWIEITNQCNLRCKHCYNESDQKCDKKMSIEQYRMVIDLLVSKNVKNIQIISNCSIKSCQIGYKSQKIKVSFQ